MRDIPYRRTFPTVTDEAEPGNALTTIASVLGGVSWLGALVGMILFLAGPFTWFMTWLLLLYAMPFALGLYGLTFLAGLAALLTRPDWEPVPPGARRALTAAGIGFFPYAAGLLLVLACLFT